MGVGDRREGVDDEMEKKQSGRHMRALELDLKVNRRSLPDVAGSVGKSKTSSTS